MLSQYNPKTALYFGNRFAVEGVDEGYMAGNLRNIIYQFITNKYIDTFIVGGGYILSKKALIKFSEKLIMNHTLCQIDGSAEDIEIGKCLSHSAIFVDSRDELRQKRFFPVGVEEHMSKVVDSNYWYRRNQYYQAPQGNVDCCSATSIEFHYIEPPEMYALEYYIYKVHPFGTEDHSNKTLPRKFSLKEIIKASDHMSSSPNFRSHKNYHDLESSEFF